MLSSKKIVSLKKAVLWRIKQKKANKRIVFTNGCFDIIHSGHIKLLRNAKLLGDALIIGLNSDNSVKKIKGAKRPVNAQKDRADVLSALEYVDLVVIFNEQIPYNIIKVLKPDVLVKGGDYKISEIIGAEFVKKVVRIPVLRGYSTSKIIKKIGGKI